MTVHFFSRLSAFAAAVLFSIFSVSLTAAPSLDGAVERSVDWHLEDALDPNRVDDQELATYIVLLVEPPAARYRGGIPGMEATSPLARGENRFQSDTPATRQYQAYLQQRQQEVLAGIAQQTGVNLDPERRWQLALNGFAVEMDARTARAIQAMPEVRRVKREIVYYPLTFAGPQHINAPAIWDGTATGVDSKGEDTVVAIVDSGINSAHESFAEVAPGDGYTHTNPLGAGNYIGVCDPEHPDFDSSYQCNDKLIGAFFMNGSDAHDGNGHGTHVASTAAGNELTTPDDLEISGVAPRANIINYKVCDGGCIGMPDVADDILSRGDLVDAVNYSIGPTAGGGNPYGEASAEAFLSLNEAGILVAAAGGNSGPGAETISNFGPWNMTVASTNHGGTFAQGVSVTGPGTVPAELQDMPGVPSAEFELASDLSGDLVDAADAGDELACNALTADSMTGAIGVARRGDCNFTQKVQNMADAGAVGAVITNNVAGAPIPMGGDDPFALPAVMITLDDGTNLYDWIATETGPTGMIGADSFVASFDGDVMAESSSRGPGEGNYTEFHGPDVSAPGDGIYAAWIGGEDEYNTIGGTSMASPHVAGAILLMRALYPDWTAQEVLSALMLSAVPDTVVKEDGETPADVFDRGNGRVDIGAAAQAGLVLNETRPRFEDANPSGGTLGLHELNIPFLSQEGCIEQCEWTRTFKAVRAGNYEFSVSGDVDGSVQPTSATLAEDEEVTVTVTVTGPRGEADWVFGELLVSETSDAASDARLPISVLGIEGPVELNAASSVDTGLTAPWGLGHGREADGSLWIGADGEVHEFDLNVQATGTSIPADWLGAGETGGGLVYTHAFDSYWQLDVGGSNCLHEWTPAGGDAANSICPTWDESVQAVAYDRSDDTLWAAGASGILQQINANGDILDTVDLRDEITGLAIAEGSGRLYAMRDTADDAQLLAFDMNAGFSVVAQYTLSSDSGAAAFAPGDRGDLAISCDGLLFASDPGTGFVHIYDVPADGVCPSSELVLDGLVVPGGIDNAASYDFMVPGGAVDGLSWDLTYETTGGAWLDEFRMEIESPDGTVILAGGAAGAFGAPGDEVLDYDFGWDGSAGTASDQRTITDFDGEASGGTWTVRLWGSWDGADPAGSLINGSLIEIGNDALSLAFDPDGGGFLESETVNVTISNADDTATIYYTTDGSTPDTGSDSITSGGSVAVNGTVGQTITLQAYADTSEGDTPVQSRDYAFYDEVAIEDEDGGAMGNVNVAAGGGVVFTPTNGSGNYSVDAGSNNVTGSDATGELSEEAGDWTFTAPSTGAFAGSYEITVTDSETGNSQTFTVDVDLLVEADFSLLLEGDDPRELRVLGATPGYSLGLEAQDELGDPTGIVILGASSVSAVDDAEAGNPAATTAVSDTSNEVAFQIEVDDTGGTYDTVVADGFATAASRHYAGWVSSEFGDLLADASVMTTDEVGPTGSERRYQTSTDGDGEFVLITPVPDSGEHGLTVSADGFAMANVDGADCVGTTPQCEVVLEAGGEIQGSLLGLLDGEELALSLTDADSGETIGPMLVTADGSGSDAFVLPAVTTRNYANISVEGAGYESLVADNGGAGFSFAGGDDVIAGVELEPVPTTPVIVDVSVTANDRTSATATVTLEPMDRAGTVVIEYGEDGEGLSQSSESVSYTADGGEITVTVDIADLSCGDDFNARAVVSNDRDMGAESDTVAFATNGCGGSSGGCALTGAGDRVDPMMPLLALMGLLGLLMSRRRV